MILADYHTHTHLSSDSDALPEAQVQAAVRAGLKYLCFTDHHDIDFPEVYEIPGNFLTDMDRYRSELLPLREKYRDQISLHYGIELGLMPDLGEKPAQFLQQFPFEYVIGSTHLVDRLDIYYPEYWEDKTEKQGILRYYEDTLQNVQNFDCFDCYGHLDYIVRYSPTQTAGYRMADYQEVIDEILRTLIAKGKGIECNTAGYKYGLGRPNPDAELLKRYRELGGEILTIGSDGHKPEHIAYDFAKLPELLESCGFRYYTIFKDRKPEFLPVR